MTRPQVLTEGQWLGLLRLRTSSEFGTDGRGELDDVIGCSVLLMREDGLAGFARSTADRWLQAYREQTAEGFVSGPLCEEIARECERVLGVPASEGPPPRAVDPADPWAQWACGPDPEGPGVPDSTGLTDPELVGLLRDELTDDDVQSGLFGAVASAVEWSRPGQQADWAATGHLPMACLAYAVEDLRKTPLGAAWVPGPLLVRLVDAMRHRAEDDWNREQYARLRFQVGLADPNA